MTLSVLDTVMIAAWIVMWFMVVGIMVRLFGVLKIRRKNRAVLGAAAHALTDKLKKSVYTQAEFDEIVRMMKKKDEK